LGVEAGKEVHNLTASVASERRLSTNEVSLSEHIIDLPCLDQLLKHKKLRKLWQETRDPACKMAVNCISKLIGCMTHKGALEQWEKIN
jgi:hypothetical protein